MLKNTRISIPHRFLAYILAFTLAFPPILSYADNEAPIVSVVGFRNSDSLVEKQFRSMLVQEIERSNKAKTIPDDVVGPHVDDMWNSQQKDISDRLDVARKELSLGKKFYDQLDIDQAIVHFNEAVKGFRESLGALRDNRYLLASHLYLGMALVIRGNMAEGKEYIRQMIILDPDRARHRLPPKDFPPKIVSIYNKLTKEISQGPAGTLSLRTNPIGAEVFLDGVQQLPTPVDLKIPLGEHFIVAQKKGYGRFSQRVVVQLGKNPIEASLEEWQPLSPYPQTKRNDPVSNETLQRLGSVLGSPILVLGSLNESSTGKITASSQLYDTRSKEFSKIESIQIDTKKIQKSAEELRKKILQGITVHGLVIAEISQESQIPGVTKAIVESPPSQQKLVGKSASSDEKKEFYETWWFWTILGSVVVGAGAASYLLLKPSSDSHVFTIDNPLN